MYTASVTHSWKVCRRDQSKWVTRYTLWVIISRRYTHWVIIWRRYTHWVIISRRICRRVTAINMMSDSYQCDAWQLLISWATAINVLPSDSYQCDEWQLSMSCVSYQCDEMAGNPSHSRRDYSEDGYTKSHTKHNNKENAHNNKQSSTHLIIQVSLCSNSFCHVLFTSTKNNWIHPSST